MSGRLGLRKKKKERGKTGENHDNGAITQCGRKVHAIKAG